MSTRNTIKNSLCKSVPALLVLLFLCGCSPQAKTGTVSFDNTNDQNRSTTGSTYDRCLRSAALGYRNGDYQAVEQAYKKAIDEAKDFDLKDPRRSLPIRSLATAYQEQGKYQEAQPLFESALKIDKEILGTEHADVARDLGLLLVNYQTQGKFPEAEPLLQQAVEILEKLAVGKPETATAHADLARNQHQQKKFALAQSHLLKAIEIDEKNYGKEHLKVAEDLSGLAEEACQAQKKVAEAEACYKRILAIQVKLLGANNQQVVQTKRKYAAFLREQKREAEADKIEGEIKRKGDAKPDDEKPSNIDQRAPEGTPPGTDAAH